MMRKIALTISFLFLTPTVLLISLFFFLFSTYQKKHPSFFAFSRGQQAISYAALPTTENGFKNTIISKDARTEMVRQFMARYNSPLMPFSRLIVETADKYGLDFRLIPAIAMQESNLCRVIPDNSYNCWGFGIYGGKVTRFKNYEEAIITVTKALAHNYKKRGLTTPDEIMSMYTPSSNGSWARGVNHFMNQLQ